MNILIGIWKDEDGSTYYKCTNCSKKSTSSTQLSVTMLEARAHRKDCEKPGRWTNFEVEGKKQTLVGIEMICL